MLDSLEHNWHKLGMKENIILVGLMGAGKSTIGRKLAAMLNMEFYDSDREIEERTGVDIATIFEIEGEQGFRDREEQVIADLCGKKNIVLATGGGSVLRKANRQLMSKSGHVVYLRTTADLLYSRIRYDKSRPLMQTSNPLRTLKNLLDEREPFYLEIADTIMKTGKQKVLVIVKRIHQIFINDRNAVDSFVSNDTHNGTTQMNDNANENAHDNTNKNDGSIKI